MGTSLKTNPNMIKTLKNDKFYPTLFTNTAVDTDKNEPWWEGYSGEIPKNMIDWRGKKWDGASGAKAAHPNARFTASIYNCPMLSKEYDNPKGVPISAIIIGGRRTQLVPLVVESFNWQHGVYLAARMGAETTPRGYIPSKKDINLEGLNISEKEFNRLFEVKMDEWKDELEDTGKFLATFGKRLPAEIIDEHNKLLKYSAEI